MKKKLFQRFGALALSMMMVCSLMATPAFAADHTHVLTEDGTRTLTIENANKGASYKFYKLLDLVPGLNEAEDQVVSYRYTIPAENAGPIMSAVREVLGTAAFKYDATSNPIGFQVYDGTAADTVVFMQPELMKGEGETDDDFAKRQADQKAQVDKLMYDFSDVMRLKLEGIEDLTPTHTVTADALSVADGDNIVFTGLTDGYWMVTTDAGVRSIVFTDPGAINGGVTMVNKNPAPTLEKEVWDEDDIYAEDGKVQYVVCEDPDCTDSHTWINKDTGAVAEEGAVGAVKAHVGKYEGDNDAGVNEKMTFRITVDAKSGARNMMVVDTLDKGLRFDGTLDSVVFYPRTGREVKLHNGYKDNDTDGGNDKNVDTDDHIELLKDEEYTLSQETSTDGETVLKIQFKHEFLDPDVVSDNAAENVYKGDPTTIEDDGGKIVITYSVKLDAANETLVEKTEFVNSALLKYSGDRQFDNNPEKWIDTDEKTTKTYTYELDLFKHVKGSVEALPGAKFALYKVIWNTTDKDFRDGKIVIDKGVKDSVDIFDRWVADGGNVTSHNNAEFKDGTDIHDGYYDGDGVMYFTVASSGSETEPAVYVPVVWNGNADADMSDWTHEIVTPASGKVVIRGLDAGLYAFGELEAPDGYNKLEKSELAVIGDTVIESYGKVFVSDETDATGLTFKPLKDTVDADSKEVRIANASGIRMPETGGIGTTIFYVVGGILVFGAAVLLIVKRRVGSEK